MEKILFENLNTKIQGAVNTVVIVSAEWCGQCKMVKMLVEKLIPDYPSVVFAEMDADGDNLWNVEELNVTQVPTFLFYKNGELVKNISGYQYEETLRDILNTL